MKTELFWKLVHSANQQKPKPESAPQSKNTPTASPNKNLKLEDLSNNEWDSVSKNALQLEYKNIETLVSDGQGISHADLLAYFQKEFKTPTAFGELSDTQKSELLVVVMKAGRVDLLKKWIESKQLSVWFEDSQGNSLMHMAAEAGSLECVKVLVDLKTPGHRKNDRGEIILHAAAQSGNLKLVKYLVEAGADPKAKDNEGSTVLLLAVKSGSVEMVKYLVEAGADPKAKDNKSYTVLHCAAQSGSVEMVKYLVEAGADPKVKDNESYSVLHRAAQSGSVEMVKYLVAAGADPNPKDNKGFTVLELAVNSGSVELVKYLVEAGADPKAETGGGYTVLELAVKSGSVELVKYLVEAGADPNGKSVFWYTVLHHAAESGSVEIVKYLVEAGADLKAKPISGDTVLELAVKSGSVEVVKYLVDSGADLKAKDKDGYRVLCLAVKSGSVELVKYLVAAGADLNGKSFFGHTVLHDAAESGSVEVVKYLVAAGADLNAKERGRGYTVLHHAAERGTVEVFKYLVDAGADLKAETDSGDTVLTLAAQSGNLKLVKYLVDAGAVLKVKDNDKDRVLLLAFKSGSVELVKCLVDAGADLKVKYNEGYTILHYAAESGSVEMVKYLVDAGADLKAKNNWGSTVLRTAVRKGNVRVAFLILSALSGKNISNLNVHLEKFSHENEIAQITVLKKQGKTKEAQALINKVFADKKYSSPILFGEIGKVLGGALPHLEQSDKIKLINWIDGLVDEYERDFPGALPPNQFDRDPMRYELIRNLSPEGCFDLIAETGEDMRMYTLRLMAERMENSTDFMKFLNTQKTKNPEQYLKFLTKLVRFGGLPAIKHQKEILQELLTLTDTGKISVGSHGMELTHALQVFLQNGSRLEQEITGLTNEINTLTKTDRNSKKLGELNAKLSELRKDKESIVLARWLDGEMIKLLQKQSAQVDSNNAESMDKLKLYTYWAKELCGVYHPALSKALTSFVPPLEDSQEFDPAWLKDGVLRSKTYMFGSDPKVDDFKLAFCQNIGSTTHVQHLNGLGYLPQSIEFQKSGKYEFSVEGEKMFVSKNGETKQAIKLSKDQDEEIKIQYLSGPKKGALLHFVWVKNLVFKLFQFAGENF
jgi:ankyrin repeat protein